VSVRNPTLKKGRRRWYEILRTILAGLGEAGPGGAVKTHIMFASELNPLVFEEYLDYSLSLGLVATRTEANRVKFTLTERGAGVLSLLDSYSLYLREAGEAAWRMLHMLGAENGNGGEAAQWRSSEALMRAIHSWTPGKRVNRGEAGCS
jgi:predicted transcriptional regulator